MQGIVKGGNNDGGSNIKSIQTFYVALGTATLTYDITLSTVDMDKSVVLIDTYNTASEQIKFSSFYAELTSSTNVKVTRYAQPSANTVTVSVTVIEYNNVKSLQRGLKSFDGNPSRNVTISAVNVDKSLIFISKSSATTTAGFIIPNGYARLSSTTNLNYTEGGTYTRDFAWQVIEFN